MPAERRRPSVGRVVFGSVMLALVGVLMAVGTTSARSAAMPLGASGQTLAPQGPAGGEKCWDTIPSANVPERNNFLLGAAAQGNHTLAGGYSAVGFGPRTQLVQVYNGNSFEIVPNPPNLPYQTFVRAVADDPSEENSYWLVGSKNAKGGPAQTWVQRYENGALTEVPSPNFGTMDNALNDVDAVEEDSVSQIRAWLVGLTTDEATQIYDALILRSTASGIERETIPDLPGNGPSELLGVKAFPDGRAIAVGYTVVGTGLRNLALGRNANGVWQQLTIPIPGPGSDLVSVDAISPNEIWAVGTYFDSAAAETRGYALRGTGSLNTWDWFWEQTAIDFGPTPLPDGGTRDVSEIDCVSEGNCIVTGIVGYGSTFESYVLKLEGTTWTPATGRPVVSPQDRFETIGRRRHYGDIFVVGTSRQEGQNMQTLVQRFLTLNSCYAPIPTRTSTRTAVTTGTPSTATSTPTATPTACTPGEFTDVPPGHTFYPFIKCLADRGHVSGYSDCTFRPQLHVTRGQLSKIVSNSADLNEPVSGQIYADVPPNHPFYEWIQRLSQRGYAGGYPCGDPNELCDSQNRPYFRSANDVTRGQMAKIVSNAAAFNEPVSGQTFQDVSPSSPFYQWIERLAKRAILGGYECGGPGEPCRPGNRAYFRYNNNTTRGQASKVLANAFFPECQNP